MPLDHEGVDGSLAAAYRQAVHGELSPIAVLLTSADGTVAYASLALCETLGVDRERAMGRHWLSLVEDAAGTDVRERGADLAKGSPAGFTLHFERGRRELRLGMRRMGRLNRGCLLGLLEDETAARGRRRSTHEALFSLCDAMPQIVWTLDAEGRPTFVNERHVTYTGQSVEAALAEGGAFRTSPPEDVMRMHVAWARARRRRDAFEVELRVRRHDGALRWHLVRAVPIRGESGAVEAWFATGTDIHDLKAAVEALDAQQSFVARIGEATPDVVFLYDLREERNVFSNAASLPVLGYTPGELQAMGPAMLRTLCHPDDWPRALAHTAASAASSESSVSEIEFRCVKPGGETVWINIRSLAFERDAEGRATVNLGIARDVTAQRLALAEREEHTRLLENALDGIAMVDARGYYVWANGAYARIVGRAPESLVGARPSLIVHPREVVRLAALEVQMRAKGRVETDCVGLRPDGTEFHKRLVMIPALRGGRVHGALPLRAGHHRARALPGPARGPARGDPRT